MRRITFDNLIPFYTTKFCLSYKTRKNKCKGKVNKCLILTAGGGDVSSGLQSFASSQFPMSKPLKLIQI